MKRKESKFDLNLIKKNLKLRKSQEKVEKPVRFNTEAYDKEDENYLIKLKKNSKKSKMLASTKQLKTLSALRTQIW